MNFRIFSLFIAITSNSSLAFWPTNSLSIGTTLKSAIEKFPEIKKIDVQNYQHKIGKDTYLYHFDQLKLSEISLMVEDQNEIQKWMANKKFILIKPDRPSDRPVENYQLIEVESGLTFDCIYPLKISKVTKSAKSFDKKNAQDLKNIIQNLSKPEVIKK